MTYIVTLLGGIRATIFAALCVALAATVGIQSHRLGNARFDRNVWKASAESAAAVNRENLATIADLQEANRKWAALLGTNKKDAAAAVAAVERERDALADELEKRREQREALYGKDQDAAAWGRTRVPAGIVSGLRD